MVVGALQLGREMLEIILSELEKTGLLECMSVQDDGGFMFQTATAGTL